MNKKQVVYWSPFDWASYHYRIETRPRLVCKWEALIPVYRSLETVTLAQTFIISLTMVTLGLLHHA